MGRFSRSGLALAGLTFASSVSAAVLEEVIVTAQLRSQSLADVPVSVSAVSGDKMFEAGIGKMEDLQAYVPNLTMTEVGLGTSIYIRGIGSGENQGFEQSVGTYVDGIYYGRAQLARAPFLDLAQVEVLRGPQNILYGKNSIAGAISVRTANPNQQFEGLASIGFEPTYQETTADLVLSGPVNDEFMLRFALRAHDSDGYMDNAIDGTSIPQREDYTVRLKGLWDMSDTVTGTFKFEHGRFDVFGRQTEVIRDSESVSDVPFFAGRTYAEIMNNTQVPGVIDIDEHPSVLDVEADYNTSRQLDFSNNRTFNLTAQFDRATEDGTFTSITGLMAYNYDEECDCDYTGVRLFRLALQEEYTQFSQEFRFVSPVGDTFEYIGGAYFQYNDLYFFDSILVTNDIITQVVNAADATEGGARGDNDPNPLGGSPEEIAGIGDAGNALAGIRSPRDFNSESAIASAFFQGTWNLTEDFRLTLGGRLTYERKTGARKMEFAFPDGTIQPLGEVDTAAAVSFGTERHDLKGERSETQFSPLVNMQYYLNEEVMLYANLSRGYKAGGYDARSNASPSAEPTPVNPNAPGGTNRQVLIGSFEYEPEEATSFEFGTKMGILEGAGELNAAIFYTQFDDLQVSVFDGTLGFNVGNAATAVSYGLEMDGRLALSEHWLLSGGLSLLSFEYDDHLAGTCVQGQTPNAPNGVNCDYSGKTGQYVSDVSGNILLAYENTITDDLLFRGNLDILFKSDYNPSPNLDERVEQDGYVQLNGRVSVSTLDGKWDVALVGENLTDELILNYTQDVPSAYTITEAATHFGFTAPRRTVTVQLAYRF